MLIFEGKVLQAKIDFQLANTKMLRLTRGITPLEKMLTDAQNEYQQAVLNYELGLMSNELMRRDQAKKHWRDALELYQKLYEKTPSFEYKQRIEELLSINDGKSNSYDV